MKCEVAIDLIADSLADELDAGTRRRLDDHLRTCPSCADEAAELERLWADLDRLPVPETRPANVSRLGRPAESGRRSRRLGALSRAAAVFLLLGGGFLAGRLSSPGIGPVEDAGGHRFLLLIRGSAPERRASDEQLFAEYSDWGARLADDGALITAAELTNDARWVRGDESDESDDELGGFFLIRAPDFDAAERIARSSPHVAYGGAIEIRAVTRR
ncbi:MAG: hypothetical protein GWN99_19710 [Gemmatimonadetes bacterium]|uniref:Zinc-finger domain-containing protein n=1 Tax=Candidatus Kutchimonas denitrificans TaxID=3056748 RepID=A0AAE4ZC72_9BACT|nr:hypothetical protein [Gemmatimonadota bacterium]NIR76431.1 hypothetical protein [Candidatus Kutchimonas denitrificans]NIS03250.1 hypothetical protein [Gemmatimonadota bacterium]NIT69111.1 hypothetical protein [Gemmatimonadota bacterium]NIU54503.1 hypothetical protein [Gemmatimonadota bacterium]